MRWLPVKKPGFLTRLGNIIIIQVIFVFAALAIVIFSPESRDTVDSEYVYMQERLTQAGTQLAGLLDANTEGPARQLLNPDAAQQATRLLDIDNVARCFIYILRDERQPTQIFSFTRPGYAHGVADGEVDFNAMVDRAIIQHQINLAEGSLIPIIHNSRFFVYYYQVKPEKHPPLVIVAISDHLSGFASVSQVRYTFFVLFLVSALVSLLTVHLINKRFQEPLERLTKGFERTVKGELYSLVETDMDDELSKLAKAYNEMSLTLWENHRQLSDYNTQLEEANEMLVESQEFLGTLIDSSPGCIISTSLEGEITLFNRKATEVFGIERRQIVGRNIDELFTHKLSDIKTSKAIIGDYNSLEVLCRRGDGSFFPAYLITAPVNTRDGQVWAYLYLVKDITDSKNFQEMMVRLDRYYTRGEMAGDIAHEINNFLAILSGNVELMPLLIDKGNPEKIGQKLEVMRGTIDRIVRFTDGLMDSHEDQVKFEMADINQLVETVIAFLKPQNRFDGIDIRTSLSTDIPLIELDSGQVQQLLVNLVYNASEALENIECSPFITIGTDLVRQDDPARMVLRVHDNGPGVQPDKQKLLFKKRFTTKRKGHGIGLITCKRIVDTHGGSISYRYSDGALFQAELPLVRRAAQVPSSNEPQPEPAPIKA
ncbi:MAG: PAS domain S-box protein [Candidatus Zixiibacteriota bacterium]|nr:MAG: PAS domain S-box protein [candidate division Zixibacteria bacterium]